jgi:hypothetical protein
MRPQVRISLGLGVSQTYAYATTYYLPAVIAGAAAAELRVSGAELLGGFSLALLVSGLCAPRVGRVIDRVGGRGLMAAGSVVMAAGLAMLASAQGMLLWYAAWLVAGLGMAMGLYEAAFASIGRLYGRESRPIITNVTLIAGFASTIGWPVGAALIGPLGWRGLVLLYAAFHLLLNLPLVLLCVPKPAAAAEIAAPAPRDGAALLAARRAFLLLAVFFTTRAVIAAILSVHAIVILERVGLGTTAAVGVASLFGPGQVAGRLLEMLLGRRLNPLWSARLGSVLLPAGAVALLLFGPAAAVVFALGYGMSNGILTINRGTLPMAVFGPHGYAALMGRLARPSLVASALAPTLVAPLIEGWSGMAMIACAGAAAGVAALCLLPLRVR